MTSKPRGFGHPDVGARPAGFSDDEDSPDILTTSSDDDNAGKRNRSTNLNGGPQSQHQPGAKGFHRSGETDTDVSLDGDARYAGQSTASAVYNASSAHSKHNKNHAHFKATTAIEGENDSSVDLLRPAFLQTATTWRADTDNTSLLKSSRRREKETERWARNVNAALHMVPVPWEWRLMHILNGASLPFEYDTCLSYMFQTIWTLMVFSAVTYSSIVGTIDMYYEHRSLTLMTACLAFPVPILVLAMNYAMQRSGTWQTILRAAQNETFVPAIDGEGGSRNPSLNAAINVNRGISSAVPSGNRRYIAMSSYGPQDAHVSLLDFNQALILRMFAWITFALTIVATGGTILLILFPYMDDIHDDHPIIAILNYPFCATIFWWWLTLTSFISTVAALSSVLVTHLRMVIRQQKIHGALGATVASVKQLNKMIKRVSSEWQWGICILFLCYGMAFVVLIYSYFGQSLVEGMDLWLVVPTLFILPAIVFMVLKPLSDVHHTFRQGKSILMRWAAKYARLGNNRTQNDMYQDMSVLHFLLEGTGWYVFGFTMTRQLLMLYTTATLMLLAIGVQYIIHYQFEQD